MFVGALKRKGEMTALEFEIPTLCRADDMLTAWVKLRRIKPTEQLSVAQCNQFSNAVASACDRHFSDLVEPPVGRETLYTHLFRKIYATIATYFYCPLTVDEAEYRAHIQGHFSGHGDLTLAERRTIASDRHYRAYAIADEHGNARKGIRLGWRDVVVLAAFATGGGQAVDIGDPDIGDQGPVTPSVETAIEMSTGGDSTNEQMPDQERETEIGIEMEPEQYQEHRTMAQGRCTTLPIWYDHRQRWNAVIDAIAPIRNGNGRSDGNRGTSADRKEDRLSAVLDWIETRLEQEQQAQNGGVGNNQPSQDIAAILAQQSQAIALLSAKVGGDNPELTDHIERLESDNQQLALERDQAVSVLDQVRALVSTQFDGESTLHQQAIVLTAQDETPVEPPPATQDDPHQDRKASDFSSDDHHHQPAIENDTPNAPLDPDIINGVEAIIQYNNSVQHHRDRWCISFPVMQELMKTIGKGTLPKIKDVFDAMRDEIDQHHRQLGIGKRHNRCHTNESITQFVSLNGN